MKILFITGDDYSAMGVEQEIGIEKAAKMTIDNGGSLTINDDELYAELSILEFKEVDEKFIEFIKDKIMDYDDAKHTDFYVIEK